MKKIIYGILVLIGGVLIASNFNLDTNKLDHKKVSASGVGCRWISESGYGVGPYYFTNDNISGTPAIGASSIKLLSKDSVVTDGLFKVLSCNSSISGQTKNGNLIYTSTGDPYTGYIGYYHSTGPAETYSYGRVIEIVDGKIKKHGQSDSDGNNIVVKSTALKSVSFNYSNFNVLAFNDFDAIFHNYSSSEYYRYQGEFAIDYDTDVNGDGEFTFTCVCAEY